MRSHITQHIISKAKKIKMLLLDVDGVLTNGSITYTSNGEEIKSFHVHDGLGLKLLRDSGVSVGIITKRSSPALSKRLQELKIQHVFQGQTNKLETYSTIKKTTGLSDEQFGYIGDDLPDLCVLKKVGLSIGVANCTSPLKSHVDHITKMNGGEGAVREVCEMIMKIQGTFENAIEKHL